MPKAKSLIKRPINRIYLVESVQIENKAIIANAIKNIGAEKWRRAKRKAAITDELRVNYVK